MELREAILNRRSVRKYSDKPVDKDMIAELLETACWAPSGMNRQPWHFVVVTDKDKQGMLSAMRESLEWMEHDVAQSDKEMQLLKGAWNTFHIMEQAPVTIFILNPYGKAPFEGLEAFGERFDELANVQSVGAAIENMCLAATEQGLGSLWIADVYAAYHTLLAWLETADQLVAALSIGYADEAPQARPRKAIEDVTVCR